MSSPQAARLEHDIRVSLARGDLEAAAATAADCRAAWPMSRVGWLFGSVVALLRDERDLALRLVEGGLQAAPMDWELWLQKAEALLAAGDRPAALAAAGSAQAAAGEATEALACIGDFFVHGEEPARALATYDRALAVRSDGAVRTRRAAVRQAAGDISGAIEDYEAVLASSPTDTAALTALTALQPQTAQRNRVAALTQALAAAPSDSMESARLHYTLAHAQADLDQPAASWRHLLEANRMERARLHYTTAEDRAVIEALIHAFADAIPPEADGDGAGAAPIFILGLPHPGLAQLERMLAARPAVHAAGELRALPEAAAAQVNELLGRRPADWVEFARTLARLDGPAVAQDYARRASAWRGARARFTDRQPTNFLQCGLIARAFPAARIVHLTHQPLAICHAIFANSLAPRYPFAADLGEIAEFYVGYRRLMDHWQRLLPGRILEVSHADLALTPEQTLHRLLAFLSLPIEADCMAAQPAMSSGMQALQSWRMHAAELAPLRARFEAAGITVD